MHQFFMYKSTDIIQSDTLDLEFSNNKVYQETFSNNFSKSVLFLSLPVEYKEVKPSKSNSSNIHRTKNLLVISLFY